MEKPSQNITLIGGMSFPGRIAIISDKFRSVATWNKIDGKEIIKTVVTPLPIRRILKPVLRVRWLPIPKTIRLFLFLFISGNLFVKLFILFFVVSAFLQIFYPSEFHEIEGSMINPFATLMIYTLWIVILIAAIRFIKATRPWHGAEHMAIETYRKSGSSHINDIRKASPVNPRCGGRFFVPFLLISFFVPPIAHYFKFPNLLTNLIAIEVILWIDALIGFYRIPVFAQLSDLLQKYLTTKIPTDRELQTAQAALEKLLEAHTQ